MYRLLASKVPTVMPPKSKQHRHVHSSLEKARNAKRRRVSDAEASGSSDFETRTAAEQVNDLDTLVTMSGEALDTDNEEVDPSFHLNLSIKSDKDYTDMMSPDGSVRLLAERNLQHKLSLTRKIFKPAVTVRDTMVEDPSRSRKTLLAAVKRRIQEKDRSDRLSKLEKLEKQVQMIASVEENEIEIWANTVQSLPAQQMRFVLNAAVDTLPHNTNLHLWGKDETFCEEWVSHLGRDDLVSLSLFICFQLSRHLGVGETKVAELSALVIGKSDKTVREWRKSFYEHDGEIQATSEG